MFHRPDLVHIETKKLIMSQQREMQMVTTSIMHKVVTIITDIGSLSSKYQLMKPVHWVSFCVLLSLVLLLYDISPDVVFAVSE